MEGTRTVSDTPLTTPGSATYYRSTTFSVPLHCTVQHVSPSALTVARNKPAGNEITHPEPHPPPSAHLPNPVYDSSRRAPRPLYPSPPVGASSLRYGSYGSSVRFGLLLLPGLVSIMRRSNIMSVFTHASSKSQQTVKGKKRKKKTDLPLHSPLRALQRPLLPHRIRSRSGLFCPRIC